MQSVHLKFTDGFITLGSILLLLIIIIFLLIILLILIIILSPSLSSSTSSYCKYLQLVQTSFQQFAGCYHNTLNAAHKSSLTSSHLIIYYFLTRITPRSRVFLERLTGSQLVKKCICKVCEDALHIVQIAKHLQVLNHSSKILLQCTVHTPNNLTLNLEVLQTFHRRKCLILANWKQIKKKWKWNPSHTMHKHSTIYKSQQGYGVLNSKHAKLPPNKKDKTLS